MCAWNTRLLGVTIAKGGHTSCCCLDTLGRPSQEKLKETLDNFQRDGIPRILHSWYDWVRVLEILGMKILDWKGKAHLKYLVILETLEY